jgi:hypothetical protein
MRPSRMRPSRAPRPPPAPLPRSPPSPLPTHSRSCRPARARRARTAALPVTCPRARPQRRSRRCPSWRPRPWRWAWPVVRRWGLGVGSWELGVGAGALGAGGGWELRAPGAARQPSSAPPSPCPGPPPIRPAASACCILRCPTCLPVRTAHAPRAQPPIHGFQACNRVMNALRFSTTPVESRVVRPPTAPRRPPAGLPLAALSGAAEASPWLGFAALTLGIVSAAGRVGEGGEGRG